MIPSIYEILIESNEEHSWKLESLKKIGGQQWKGDREGRGEVKNSSLRGGS